MTYFLITFIALLLIILFLDLKYNLLRDDSTAPQKKPYSFARVQLAWWSLIVLSAFVAVIIETKSIPDLYQSTLVLLGISGGTVAAARIVDVSDQRKLAEGKIAEVHQNLESKGFLIDILSDQNGVSIHRLQTVFFNIAIGSWFLFQTGKNLNNGCDTAPCHLIPDITENNLILLGLSVGMYTVLKSAENAKPPVPAPAPVPPVADPK
jgi:hypothetical protein